MPLGYEYAQMPQQLWVPEQQLQQQQWAQPPLGAYAHPMYGGYSLPSPIPPPPPPPPRALVVCALIGDTEECGKRLPAVDGNFPTDALNSPYERRRAILRALGLNLNLSVAAADLFGGRFNLAPVEWLEDSFELALLAHEQGLLTYLDTAWERWVALAEMRPPDFCCEADLEAAHAAARPPALVPANGLFRDGLQLPGRSVLSQACFYHADRFTPIFAGLREALLSDLAVVRTAVDALAYPRPSPHTPPPPPVYAMVAHPGHHATGSTSGGFCYLNNAAIAARLLQRKAREAGLDEARCRVGVLDVDYHAGNGTISIFYEDPSVFVASLHAEPDTEYPFNSGFSQQRGAGAGEGATLCLPLAPYTTWSKSSPAEPNGETYEQALRRALDAIVQHGAQALVVSLGVDTFRHDPVHLPGAGCKLELEDFEAIGAVLAEARLPTLLLQEGGYMPDVAGAAVCKVLSGMLHALDLS
mmetsp:Transcript_23567/g.59784  ORF Transcript_23567/g.59784 Transcript_23567/m.59784 type:complete len:472 (-) Transcript_23567:242-1657(-)